MTILEALQKTTEEIKAWAESKFFNKNNIDSTLSTTSENPVQNKVINTEIENIKTLIGDIDVSEQINSAIADIDFPVDSVNGKTGAVVLTASDVGALSSDTEIPSIEGLATETYVDEAVADQISTAIDGVTADDFGIYVQANEPTEAVAGDIWIDTANDPAYIPPTLPTITEADNGKVLMVVNGTLQLVDLSLSVDANGVISM